MRDSRASRQGDRLFNGVFARGLLGLFITALLVGGMACTKEQAKAADAPADEKRVPVVIASQDIPENTVVTWDMIMQREVPEQLATQSVVKPEGAQHILNQRLLVPVRAGDMLLWSQFETMKQAQPPPVAGAQGP